MEDLYLRSLERLRHPEVSRRALPRVSHLPVPVRGGAARVALRLLGGALVLAGRAALRAAGDTDAAAR